MLYHAWCCDVIVLPPTHGNAIEFVNLTVIKKKKNVYIYFINIIINLPTGRAARIPLFSNASFLTIYIYIYLFLLYIYIYIYI